ncbi:hypothetical protein M407DRAFT_84835 [Tulasnella calospora MUT 4182]|uniref:Uncharacterized protein n=1 Tax=Tulasnella calospora MUT 4182 TaxID=1051891 RepID=A0A0C3L7T6_9AGAM|nr:hypothetical protein M407DRAFT_84835 [Tulasnella calospora MUT 4182]
MEVSLGHNAYQKLRCTFPSLDLPSLQVLRHQVQELSSITVIKYHCCPNSCICYVGAYADRQACHHCNAPRFKADGSPAKLFHYLPIVPQIRALYAGRTSAARMRYRSIHHDDTLGDEDGTICDIYDSELYRNLRNSHLPHVICAGLIPGPRKPKEHDSFMYVVVEDLAKAALGTPAYDAHDDCMFTLRIYSPLKCGDIPAMASAYTGGKHHGAEHPCRACPIKGIRIMDSNNLSYYLPITRPLGYPPQPYTVATLPLRTHSDYIRQAKEVDEAPTQNERKRLSQLYGINYTPIVAKIPGITFPSSFPYEFMHLLEGSIKNYVELFCNAFKSLGEGVESFIIMDRVWKEIGASTLKANATIPASFGRRIPNIAEDRTYMTAEGYLVWATMYAPILLRGRFREERYYRHWVKFVSLVERCLQFSITASERRQMRADIHEWYTEYERIFYQYNDERLPTCLIIFHAWLHLVDMMEQSGPLWSYWTWVMERYCGLLSRAVTSRKYPYASLNRRILEIQTLHSIRSMYDLDDRLPMYTAMYASEPQPSYQDKTHYPEFTLLHRCPTISFARDGLDDLRRRIAVHLATRYNVNVRIASQVVPESVTQWGKILIDDSDVVYAHMGYTRREENRRDATFVQYELLVDIHARRHLVEPEYEPKTFFGRLDRVFVCELPANEAIGTTQPVSLVLVDVKTCNVSQDRYGFYEYSTYGHSEVVDGTSLRTLVGRIMDRGKWVFVRRSGMLEPVDYEEEDD